MSFHGDLFRMISTWFWFSNNVAIFSSIFAVIFGRYEYMMHIVVIISLAIVSITWLLCGDCCEDWISRRWEHNLFHQASNASLDPNSSFVRKTKCALSFEFGLWSTLRNWKFVALNSFLEILGITTVPTIVTNWFETFFGLLYKLLLKYHCTFEVLISFPLHFLFQLQLI